MERETRCDLRPGSYRGKFYASCMIALGCRLSLKEWRRRIKLFYLGGADRWAVCFVLFYLWWWRQARP